MSLDNVKRKTVGLDPKVPTQAITAVLVWVAARYGVDLDADVSGALAVVIGAAVGTRAPAPKTIVVPD